MATIRRSPLALTVLATLSEEPMHAYRIQQLIKERGKDRVVNVRQRASIYQTIERLVRADLITVRETNRTAGRPERTVYEITDAGREAVTRWMREVLTHVGDEFPEFPVALAFLMALDPADARDRLRERAATIDADITELTAALAGLTSIPRLFLIEEEYRLRMLRAELEWVTELVTDLESGRLTWTEQWLRDMAAGHGLPESDQSGKA